MCLQMVDLQSLLSMAMLYMHGQRARAPPPPSFVPLSLSLYPLVCMQEDRLLQVLFMGTCASELSYV